MRVKDVNPRKWMVEGPLLESLRNSVWLIVSGNRMQQMGFDKLHHATQLEKRSSTGISQHGSSIYLTLFHGNKAAVEI